MNGITKIFNITPLVVNIVNRREFEIININQSMYNKRALTISILLVENEFNGVLIFNTMRINAGDDFIEPEYKSTCLFQNFSHRDANACHVNKESLSLPYEIIHQIYTEL